MACLELAETHLGILASLAIWLLWLLLMLLVNGRQLAGLCIAGIASGANPNSEIVLRSVCARRRVRLYGNDLIGILLARRYRILVGYLWITRGEHIAETAAANGDANDTAATGHASRCDATAAVVVVAARIERPIRRGVAGDHHRGSAHAFRIEDRWNFAVARHSIIDNPHRRS